MDWFIDLLKYISAGNYMLKVTNRNTKTRCEICSKLTIKIPERRHDFEQVIADWDEDLQSVTPNPHF